MRASERNLLDIILKAASQAVCDAGNNRLRPKELGLLNEQWTQSYVGIAINDALRVQYQDKESSHVTFETSVAWLEEFCGVEGKVGRPPGVLTERQRFDVVAWSRGGYPIGLIEIKDQPVGSTYGRTNDPQKLCSALRRWDKVRWGVFLLSLRAARGNTRSAALGELDRKARGVTALITKSVQDGQFRGHRVMVVPGPGSRILWLAALFRRPKRSA